MSKSKDAKSISEVVNIWAEENRKIASYMFAGLEADGAHHKQWCLEQAAILLVGEDVVAKMKAKYGWEEGIAP